MPIQGIVERYRRATRTIIVGSQSPNTPSSIRFPFQRRQRQNSAIQASDFPIPGFRFPNAVRLLAGGPPGAVRETKGNFFRMGRCGARRVPVMSDRRLRDLPNFLVIRFCGPAEQVWGPSPGGRRAPGCRRLRKGGRGEGPPKFELTLGELRTGPFPEGYSRRAEYELRAVAPRQVGDGAAGHHVAIAKSAKNQSNMLAGHWLRTESCSVRAPFALKNPRLARTPAPSPGSPAREPS